MKFALDVLNDREVADDITRIGERAVSAQPVLTAASEVLARGIVRNFQSRGASLGKPWPALADGSPATLIDTGGLAGQVGNMKRTTKTHAIAGTRGDRSFIQKIHQKGRNDMPARLSIGVSDRDRAVLLMMVERYLVGRPGV